VTFYKSVYIFKGGYFKLGILRNIYIYLSFTIFFSGTAVTSEGKNIIAKL